MIDILIGIFGYLASILLGLSLLVSNDIKFRLLNSGGCILFITYGVLIHAFPIILTNSILLIINAYYLIKLYTTNEHFDLIEFKGTEQLVSKFLQFYKNDIDNYFPNYAPIESENTIRFVVLRDLVIANIFIATILSDGKAVVKLNYAVPKYRDFKVGKFIFMKENKFLKNKGIEKLIYTTVHNKKHGKFLKVIGFEKQADNSYVKQLL